ncbi:MAG: DUF853 family protein [Clostridia bacterium]|nr:DUF853 family protein [Clostridia bacterium]
MLHDNKIWMAVGDRPVYLLPNQANRHGLIAGASGTGKTITLKVMAESLSAMGVPVFLADIKGDLAGMCLPGEDSESMQKRIAKLGLTECFSYTDFPTRFWDIWGQFGHPVRTTITDMGPYLLSRLLDLTEVQSDALSMVFRIADEQGQLLLDLKDLRAMVRYVGEHRKDFVNDYGSVAPQTIGAIQRSLLALEDSGGNIFFGEPALDIFDWIRTDTTGRGYINILHSVELAQNSALYTTFMLWMLSELYERMPEAGDLDKPRIVFFFDEAHMLFTDAPKALRQKVEQVIKLIRSKGVGIYFITQSPSDLPDEVLAQLSNRVQHALRAYTPVEQKAVRTAAQTFRPNPNFKTEEVITQLGTGEALVSFLDETGAPCVVERAWILPPRSKMGTIPDDVRKRVIDNSDLFIKYHQEIDRESAYELLARDEKTRLQAAEKAAQEKAKAEAAAKAEVAAKAEKEAEKAAKAKKKEKNFVTKAVERTANSALSAIGRELGRSIIRGIFGSSK